MAKPAAIRQRILVAAYSRGRREFRDLDLKEVDLSYRNLSGAEFEYCHCPHINLHRAMLLNTKWLHPDFFGADLSGADVSDASMLDAEFYSASLSRASLARTTITSARFLDTDMQSVDFSSTKLDNVEIRGTRLTNARISNTCFLNMDISALCDEDALRFGAPSIIDVRTVIRTHHNPRLKRFLLKTGLPEVFAEFMIDCARAVDSDVLRSLMQSTFISFGGPDEAFARKLYEALTAHGVITYFFPETAKVGERISDEVFRQIQQHDRVLLVCSRGSLDRVGVINEITETLDREAKDGGATYLLPITLDDYVFTEWRVTQPVLAERMCRRVIADFRGTLHSKQKFGSALSRVIDALKKRKPRSSSELDDEVDD
jgi:hypothetical protein